MKAFNHSRVYLTNRFPEGLSSGFCELSKSVASSVRKLAMVCSVDGMKPLVMALIIW